jgi:hypothetical protein
MGDPASQRGQGSGVASMLSGSAARGLPQWSQNFARSLIRARQWGQIVSRSCSRSVKSAPQNSQHGVPSRRGAPHDAHRTTEASCPCGVAIVTIVPQRQRNRLPIGRSVASYCRRQAGQEMSRRILSTKCKVQSTKLANYGPTCGPVRASPPRAAGRNRVTSTFVLRTSYFVLGILPPPPPDVEESAGIRSLSC